LIYFVLKDRVHGVQTLARFFNTAILSPVSRVWEWSGSGTDTWL